MIKTNKDVDHSLYLTQWELDYFINRNRPDEYLNLMFDNSIRPMRAVIVGNYPLRSVVYYGLIESCFSFAVRGPKDWMKWPLDKPI